MRFVRRPSLYKKLLISRATYRLCGIIGLLVSPLRYLDRRKRLIIAMNAAFGMEYLQSKNIVHFDFKCDNMLVNVKDPLRPICKVQYVRHFGRINYLVGGVGGIAKSLAKGLVDRGSQIFYKANVT